MNKFLVLLFILFSLNTQADVDCKGLIYDGEDEVPFNISLYDANMTSITGAKVRILSLKKFRSNESGPTIKETSDSKGQVTLFPLLPTFGFNAHEAEKELEDCKSYRGFHVRKGIFLIIEKKGFHTYHAELGTLQLETTFYNGEKVQGFISLGLLSDKI